MTAVFVPLAFSTAAFKIIGTLIFVAVFVGVAIWLLMSRSDRFKKAAQIPLEDDKIVEPREGAAGDDDSQESGSDKHGE